MELDHFVRLTSPEAEALLAQYAGADPNTVAFALQGAPHGLGPLVATQLALRRAAAPKLPAFVAAGCLLLREAVEQATHPAIAELRGFPRGRLAVDLTAGLGADTLALAARFDKVIALEPDPVRYHLLRHNLARLGAANVTPVHTTAEAWLASPPTPQPEFAFVDPARRTAQRTKTVALADGAPNLVALLPRLHALGIPTWAKLSPLFEPREAHGLPGIAALRALSLEGEVKELLLELDPGPTAPHLRHQAQGIWQGQAWSVTGVPTEALPTGAPGSYLLLPDPAIEKLRLTASFAQQYGLAAPRRFGPTGYLMAEGVPEGHLPARVLALDAVLPYKPKTLPDVLHARGYSAAVVHTRNVDLTPEALRQRLRITEGTPRGGEPYPRYVLATAVPPNRWVLLARRVR
ncbi:MAG: hypothetical protein SFY70_10410 [Bacteroidia bacterium]|nr:hypothetical protein [Bacteroidia bacterium]